MKVSDIVLFFSSNLSSDLFIMISSKSKQKFLTSTYIAVDVISNYGDYLTDSLRLVYDDCFDDCYILTIYVD